jgi:hypothetical protein
MSAGSVGMPGADDIFGTGDQLAESAASPTCPAPQPEFLALSDGCYMLVGPTWRLELDHLRRERGELLGELAVIVPERKGRPEVTNTATINLSSVTARKTRAKYLGELSATDAEDWIPIVEDLCERVQAAERVGQPAIMLRDLPKPTAPTLLTVDRLALAREHAAIIFGDGGTLKSWLALWVLVKLTALGLRCLFLHWELSEDEHRLRLENLCGSQMPAIQYARCDRPLAVEVDRLSRLVRVGQIDYVVIDSIAPACDGPAEASESATGFFRALRRLHVGSLCTAHTNKSETADKRPFGSAFWHNLARLTWFVERAEDCGDPGWVTTTLHNRKSNLSALHPSIGYEFRFADERTSVHPISPSTVSDMTTKAPTWQQMIGALKSGPLTQAALAEAIGAKPETIKKTVDRSKGRTFARVTGADGIIRIALVDRREA